MSPDPLSFGRLAIAPGTTLGPYQVTAKIAEGGMGQVYLARTRSSTGTSRSKFFPTCSSVTRNGWPASSERPKSSPR